MATSGPGFESMVSEALRASQQLRRTELRAVRAPYISSTKWTQLNLFLRRFLQACTERASPVSPCKAAAAGSASAAAGLGVLAAGLPAQRVGFKPGARFDTVQSFPSGHIRVSLKREGWFLLCFIFPFPLF